MSDHGSIGGKSATDQIEKKWITFKIVDDEKGEPVPKVKLFLDIGRGKPLEVTVENSGVLKLEVIDFDSCDLTSCTKGLTLMEKKGDYTLKDGDTLEGLAAKEGAKGNPISWRDIAAFNWGDDARKIEHCNEFMRDDLGCFIYDSILRQMAYKDDGTPRTIEIPQMVSKTGLSANTEHEIKVRIRKTAPQFLSCCGIPNLTFSHNDSFIRPNAGKHLAKLKEQIQEHSGAKLMIFGHTDKVGDETYNKLLSERRAKSAFSLLTKNPDYWVTLYSYGQNNPDNENWGVASVQIILNDLSPDSKLDISNILDERTIKEIETIGKPAWEDTHFGKKIPDSTLKKIFQTYFDKLMAGSDIKESDFIDLKYAGCSDFNPILDIDQSEEENRRVTFFLFDKERPPKFPCSHTDLEPCKKQCSQFNQNRSTYRKKKTFACAFYDSIAKDCNDEVIYPDVIAFDDHMHFMSGHCTPLPLLWNQAPGKGKSKISRVQRSGMDKAGWAGLRYSIAPLRIPKISGAIRGARMQRRSTLEIADIGIAQNNAIYEKVYKKLDGVDQPGHVLGFAFR